MNWRKARNACEDMGMSADCEREGAGKENYAATFLNYSQKCSHNREGLETRQKRRNKEKGSGPGLAWLSQNKWHLLSMKESIMT